MAFTRTFRLADGYALRVEVDLEALPLPKLWRDPRRDGWVGFDLAPKTDMLFSVSVETEGP